MNKVFLMLLTMASLYCVMPLPALRAAPASAKAGAIDKLESYHKYQHILQNIFHLLRTQYVTDVSEKDLLIGAIRGMLAATNDIHTRFLDREQHRKFNNQEKGKRVGIGISVVMRDGLPLIIAPIPGGPAARAGILAGDKIIGIDGNSIRSMHTGRILELISGKLGSPVELKILRQGLETPMRFSIRRGLYNLQYVHSSLLEGGSVGYLKLLQFFGEGFGTKEKFRKALESFKKRQVKGIVLDLRNNGGGHMELAIKLCGFFLRKGQVIVRARGRKNSPELVFRAKGKTGIIPESIPIVILINRGSASASEIMAGALQDYGRAKLVGERSYGKARVQRIFRPLPDDTAALITIQKYYTPKNRSLDGVGLKPDIAVRGLEPDADEKYFLRKMYRDKYVSRFKKRRPKYSAGLMKLFIKETRKNGWRFRPSFAGFFVKRIYGKYDYLHPDPKTDPQLNRALVELSRRTAK